MVETKGGRYRDFIGIKLGLYMTGIYIPIAFHIPYSAPISFGLKVPRFLVLGLEVQELLVEHLLF